MSLYDIIKSKLPENTNFQVEYEGELSTTSLKIKDDNNIELNITLDKQSIIDQFILEKEEIKIKEEKKEQIAKIATLSDQLNLIAGILAEFVLEKPEDERSELEKQALIVFYNIKDILNK